MRPERVSQNETVIEPETDLRIVVSRVVPAARWLILKIEVSPGVWTSPFEHRNRVANLTGTFETKAAAVAKATEFLHLVHGVEA